MTGAFRNIGGTIESVDSNAGTLTVKDLTSNKTVKMKITTDSQVRKLPQPMAQRIAIRLKGISPDAAGASNGAAKPGVPAAGEAQTTGGTQSGGGAQRLQGGAGGGTGGSPRNGGGGDIQQMLSRLPASALGDFQKGDAVMIVATSGQSDSEAVAITVLGGVEPILQASPQGQTSILTPWSYELRRWRYRHTVKENDAFKQTKRKRDSGMKSSVSGTIQRAACISSLAVLLFVGTALAQTTTGILRGQVTDPSGAAVVGATVLLTPASGDAKGATSWQGRHVRNQGPASREATSWKQPRKDLPYSASPMW